MSLNLFREQLYAPSVESTNQNHEFAKPANGKLVPVLVTLDTTLKLAVTISTRDKSTQSYEKLKPYIRRAFQNISIHFEITKYRRNLYKTLAFNLLNDLKITMAMRVDVTKPLLSGLAAEQSKNYTNNAFVYNDYNDGRSKFDSF